MKKQRLFLTFATSSVIVTAAFGQKFTYTTIPTGINQTTIQHPYAINNAGTILVQPYTTAGQTQTALLITGTNVKQAQQITPNDQYLSLSNTGYITGMGVGGVYLLDSQYNQTFISFPQSDTAYPTGSNQYNVVVGMANSSTTVSYGWTWKAGVVNKFIYPKSTGCGLNGVNDNGDVIGTFYLNNSHVEYYGFLTTKGKPSPIVVPGCFDPNPSSINNSGVVVGSAVISSGKQAGSVVGFYRTKTGSVSVIDYKSSAPKTVKSPYGQVPLSSTYRTEVYGVNDSGSIVGMFTGFYFDKVTGWGETIYIPFLGTPAK